jgi:D-glycero-alpha-D-manno-heptose-7-phosphate kinase
MIISRAPFRVSFCGGGSDIPSFYEKYGGCVLSTSIRKYVYLAINKAFNKDSITLKYSKTEVVTDPAKIEHRIFRQVLTDFGTKGIEITSMADIPSGTGLGSSSSFTVALLKLLYTWNERSASPTRSPRRPATSRSSKLGNPIGKQDQFAAAFGGLKFYEFCPDGFVKVEPVIMRHESYQRLQDNLLMFYTGRRPGRERILAKETRNLAGDAAKIESTKRLCQMTRELKDRLEANDVDALGPVSWPTAGRSRNRSPSGISNPAIDAATRRG